ncbi:S9 family peptidase [Dysgonomonas sp. ZJ709]|uniref:S9 family peptidase n=1 Tax=Dysgonomonas sp. ZJ709 TaxID=2709797 RepID=UPI0013ED4F32|nr:S9 family peptidase [Dysgonomonas sp. ZJ709]
MRIINSIIFALSIILPMKSYSQDIPLSLEDLIPGGKSFYKYRAEMPRQLNWYGDQLTYAKGDSIFVVPQKTNQKPQALITLEIINQKLGLEKSAELKSIGYVASLYGKSNEILISTASNSYLLNILTGETTGKYAITKEMQNKDFSIEKRIFAYTKDNNLYIQTKEGRELPITKETDKAIVNGQSAHRNEFGIHKGTFWSPKGNALAFYRMDQTMVTDYPLVDISTRVAELKDLKYPMAGMKSHQVTLGVYDLKTEKTVYLKTGTPKEKYLTNITWSPDGKSIYIAEINRGQDTCILKSYDALTGNLKSTLFTEIHPKYVEPENPVIFLKNDSDKFVWASKRDGFNHLYLYNTSGTLIKQITSGKWDVISIIGFDEKGDNLIYSSTEASPIEKHIYKINLKNGEKEQLSKEEGVHSATLSESGKYIYDIYTSQNNAGKVALTETGNNKTSIFHEAKNPYRNMQLPEITLSSLKANDGKTDLYYRLVKPLNFDPQKKYPVIVYVYGGPHSQLVDNSWLGQARGWDIYMAEKGYVVFTIDNRGTSNRGNDFENITHRQLGIIETEDQMTGVDFLKSQPYVDTERIGVHGWSYGGFMTLNLMLRHPETFKVGVAGGPVTDWKYYEIMYGERYMDSPKENPEGYKNSSMVEKAGDLKGRLMLIHGDEDPVVVMQHSMQFLKSSIKNRTHPDFFVYPGHEHNMMGVDRVHLHEHITRYFDDFLK